MNVSPRKLMRYIINDNEKKLKKRCAEFLVEKNINKLNIPTKSIIP